MTCNKFFKFWRYLVSSTLKIETAGTSEKPVHLYRTTRNLMSQKSNLQRVATMQGRAVAEGQPPSTHPLGPVDKAALGKIFSPSTSFSACQYNSTSTPYPHFIHLLSTLYELSDCQICRNTLHSLEILESHEFDLWQFYIFQSGVSREECNPVSKYKPI